MTARTPEQDTVLESACQSIERMAFDRGYLRGALEQVRSHLYSAKVQRGKSDDAIIAAHIDDALSIAERALEAIK